MNNFGHIEAMKEMLFSKFLKSYVDFGNGIKCQESIDGFEDNCVGTCPVSFCQSWQEYMWWVVNVLKSGPKISDPRKRHDTQFNLFDINGTLA